MTPRKILEQVLANAPTELGKYTLRDGTTAPALGILGLKDQRVQTTEGVEVLISLVPSGNFEYGASRHISHNSEYEFRVVQHQAPNYNLPYVVQAIVSLGHFGSVKYHVPDGSTESVPYATIKVGIPNWTWTDIEAYQQGCPWTC